MRALGFDDRTTESLFLLFRNRERVGSGTHFYGRTLFKTKNPSLSAVLYEHQLLQQHQNQLSAQRSSASLLQSLDGYPPAYSASPMPPGAGPQSELNGAGGSTMQLVLPPELDPAFLPDGSVKPQCVLGARGIFAKLANLKRTRKSLAGRFPQISAFSDLCERENLSPILSSQWLRNSSLSIVC